MPHFQILIIQALAGRNIIELPVNEHYILLIMNKFFKWSLTGLVKSNAFPETCEHLCFG